MNEKPIENENLYVNVAEVFALIDNIKERNAGHTEILNEVEDVILDLKWREIDE